MSESRLININHREDKLALIGQFVDICSKGDLDHSDISKAVDLLRVLYGKDGYRHRYSEIAKLLRDEGTPDITEALSNGLKRVEESREYSNLVLESEDGDNKIKIASEKLFDTLDLEVYRITQEQSVDQKFRELNYNASLSEDIQNAQNILKEIADDEQSIKRQLADNKKLVDKTIVLCEETNKKAGDILTNSNKLLEEANTALEKAREAKKEANDASAKAQSFNAQSMSTLGIFTAIIFAFTGSFSMIGGAFSNIKEITRNETILLVTLILFMGCLLSDIIFGLILFLDRIHFGPNKEKKPRLSKAVKTVIILNIMVVIILIALLICNYFFVTPEWHNRVVENTTTEESVAEHNSNTQNDNATVP